MKRNFPSSTLAVCAALIVGTIGLGAATAQAQARPAGRQHEMGGMMKPTDDASYVQMMRMHHQHGIEMAKLAIERATREDVKAFARKTADAQRVDVEKLENCSNR